MQRFISQIPELAQFLRTIPKHQHLAVIKQLLKVGLETANRGCSKENETNSQNLEMEIDLIKSNIQELNHKLRSGCTHRCYCNTKQRVASQEQGRVEQMMPKKEVSRKNVNYSFSPVKPPIIHVQPAEKEPTFQEIKRTRNEDMPFNPMLKDKSKTATNQFVGKEVRQTMKQPEVYRPKKKSNSRRDSKQYRQHAYQDEINREDMIKLRQQNGEQRRSSYTGSVVNFKKTKAKSKIKPMLDRDRLKYHQATQKSKFVEGFNKYEYSDEEQMEDSSKSNTKQLYQNEESEEQESIPPNYVEPGKIATNSQISRTKNSQAGEAKPINQYKSKPFTSFQDANSSKEPNLQQSEQSSEEDSDNDDIVSNSSTFSQFSISESRKREIGKISNRSINS